jgi:hypothetical protein
MMATGVLRLARARSHSSRAASREGLEGHHLLGPADALDMVAVDKPHHVGQPAMGNEERRFPDAALVELAIGGEAEAAPPVPVEGRTQGHAGTKREAMPKAARGEGDLLDRVGRRQGGKSGSLLVEGIDLTGGEHVRLRKQGIERRHRLPLGQNERVVVPHPGELQEDENLGAR